MELLQGRPVSKRIDATVTDIVSDEKPILSVFLTGSDPSSIIYSRSKVRKGGNLGVDVKVRTFTETTTEEEIVRQLKVDADNERIFGIMVERPLLPGLDMNVLMKAVPPEKDVECQHPQNIGMLSSNRPTFVPPTPLGTLLLLEHYSIETKGKKTVVIGRSPNVGRPLSILLSSKIHRGNSTVTLAHSMTRNLRSLTMDADLIFSAVGKAGQLKSEMVKDGAVVVDLGINPTEDGSVVGDADLGSFIDRDIRITPTPGGTGPVTVSSMFLNLAISLARNKDIDISNIDPMISEIYR